MNFHRSQLGLCSKEEGAFTQKNQPRRIGTEILASRKGAGSAQSRESFPAAGSWKGFARALWQICMALRYSREKLQAMALS